MLTLDTRAASEGRTFTIEILRIKYPIHLPHRFTLNFAMMHDVKSKKKRMWQEIAEEAQEYRDASIARVRPAIPQLPVHLPKNVMGIPGQVLGTGETQITEMPVESLLYELSCGGVTAVSVVTAFLRRAGLAQKLVIRKGGISSDQYQSSCRPTASLRSFLSKLWLELNIWMTTFFATQNHSDPYTAYRSASRSTLE